MTTKIKALTGAERAVYLAILNEGTVRAHQMADDERRIASLLVRRRLIRAETAPCGVFGIERVYCSWGVERATISSHPDPALLDRGLHRITAAVQEIRALFDDDHPTADDELAAILDGVAHVRQWLGRDATTRRIDQ